MATTEIYTYGHTLSRHAALPIWDQGHARCARALIRPCARPAADRRASCRSTRPLEPCRRGWSHGFVSGNRLRAGLVGAFPLDVAIDQAVAAPAAHQGDLHQLFPRSDERRLGKECVSTFITRVRA